MSGSVPETCGFSDLNSIFPYRRSFVRNPNGAWTQTELAALKTEIVADFAFDGEDVSLSEINSQQWLHLNLRHH